MENHLIKRHVHEENCYFFNYNKQLKTDGVLIYFQVLKKYNWIF